MAKRLATEDLAQTAEGAKDAFSALSNTRIFLTGGTGFFGQWLLETLLHAKVKFGLNLHVTVLTRSPEKFRLKAPHLAENPGIEFLTGDVLDFEFPAKKYTHILHAATDSVTPGSTVANHELAESVIEGTRRVLQLAKECGAHRLLYISSGAVYGRSTPLPFTPETYSAECTPDTLTNPYDQAKHAAEQLCLAAAEDTELETVIARCFAFVGPHLPLDAHFAIGNFIRDAIEGNTIEIRGDGTPRRSWMYMSDLATWLWILLVRGHDGRAYNVGSDESYSIAAAAELVAQTLRPNGNKGSGIRVHIAGLPNASAPINSYVPSISRAQEELGLKITVPLAEAVRRTARWYGFDAQEGQL